MQEYYEFIDYISAKHLEESYQYELPDTLDEIRTTLGILKPHEGFIRRYWANQVLKNWREFWCLEWLYQRSGRPMVENLDIKTTIECCKVHLDACLLINRCLDKCGCPKCYNDQRNGWRQSDV